MMISKCNIFFYPIYVRKRMHRRMISLYLGLFRNFPLMGFFWVFFPYSGHIEDAKSVEFVSFVICSRLTPILA